MKLKILVILSREVEWRQKKSLKHLLPTILFKVRNKCLSEIQTFGIKVVRTELLLILYNQFLEIGLVVIG